MDLEILAGSDISGVMGVGLIRLCSVCFGAVCLFLVIILLITVGGDALYNTLCSSHVVVSPGKRVSGLRILQETAGK